MANRTHRARRSTRQSFVDPLETAHRPGRRALLASTALSGVFIAAIAGNPGSALAACAGENTASVTCDAVTPATAGTLNTSFAGSTVVNVNPGGAITTGGAHATVTSATGTLNFNHNDPAGITNNLVGGNGLDLVTNSGSITYLGNAGVTSNFATGIAQTSPSAPAIPASPATPRWSARNPASRRRRSAPGP